MADPRDLTTVEEVKSSIELPSNDVDLDVLIPDYITAASVVIMNEYKREFAPVVTETRRFKVDSYRCDFSPYDLQSATLVQLHPETDEPLTITDAMTDLSSQSYILKPINPVRGVYQSMQFGGFLIIISEVLMQFNFALIDVTGTWGFPSIPEDVTRACTLTVGSWLTRTAPGSSTPYGIPVGGGAGAVMQGSDWHIPWSAKKMLTQYKRGSARWAF